MRILIRSNRSSLNSINNISINNNNNSFNSINNNNSSSNNNIGCRLLLLAAFRFATLRSIELARS